MKEGEERNDGGIAKIELFHLPYSPGDTPFVVDSIVFGDRKDVWYTGNGAGTNMYVKVTTEAFDPNHGQNWFYIHVEWWS